MEAQKAVEEGTDQSTTIHDLRHKALVIGPKQGDYPSLYPMEMSAKMVGDSAFNPMRETHRRVQLEKLQVELEKRRKLPLGVCTPVAVHLEHGRPNTPELPLMPLVQKLDSFPNRSDLKTEAAERVAFLVREDFIIDYRNHRMVENLDLAMRDKAYSHLGSMLAVVGMGHLSGMSSLLQDRGYIECPIEGL
jgi:hypothetical protein